MQPTRSEPSRLGWNSYIFQISIFLLAAAVLLAGISAAAAAPLTISAKYRLRLAGMKFGKAYMNSTIDNGTFAVSVYGKHSGFGRLFKFEGTTTSNGRYSQNGVEPGQYAINYHIRERHRAISMTFSESGVQDLDVNPPRGQTNDRVPVLDEHRQNVFDPISAFVFPLPAHALTGANVCNREIPVFDGRYRFNLTMHYIRTQSAPSYEEPGQVSQVFVCGMKYAPVAGHKIRDKSDFFQWANNDGVEVWLMPLQKAGLLLSYRGVFPTPLGLAVFSLDKLSIVGSAQHASAN